MVSINRSLSSRYNRQGKSLAWLDRTLTVLFLFCFYEFYWREDGASYDYYSLLDQRVCAPQKGIVVVNFLDYVAYNLLQIGFARRMATELCWDVVTYRSMWKPGFGKAEEECFANALGPQQRSSATLGAELSEDIEMTDELWTALNDRPLNLADTYEPINQMVKDWSKKLEGEGKAWRCVTPICKFDEGTVQQTIADIRDHQKVRVVYLENFFLHPEWMESIMANLKSWWTPSCACSEIPPTGSVIVHAHAPHREGSVDGKLEAMTLQARYYESLVNKYHKGAINKKVVWVVADEDSSKTQYVQDLAIQLGYAKVVVPKTPSDMLCILSKAEQGLFITPNSMPSIVSGLMTDAKTVHYLTPNTETQFGLNMTGWKYHVVQDEKLKYWNVRHKSLKFRAPWAQ